MAKQATAQAFADWIADKVRTPAIPYVEGRRSEKGTDCINLIGWGLEELTGVSYERGSNSAWRKDMIWRGTIAEAKALGYLVPGAIVYINYGPSAKWPDGAMDHAGVYVGFGYGLKNPDGRAADVVHASSSKEGVYGSILAVNAWTHIALHKGVLYPWQGTDAGIPASEAELPTENTAVATPKIKAAPGPGQAMVVTNDKKGLNLREGPDTKAKGIKTMPDDTIVDVFRFQTGADGRTWVYARWDVARGLWHEGWCCADFLEFGGDDG